MNIYDRYNSLLKILPNLKNTKYSFVANSAKDNRNCISASLNIPSPWIWPSYNGYERDDDSSHAGFWPRNLSNDTTLENFLNMYKLFGFEQTDNSEYEDGYWKNVIYGQDENNITHAAHILKDGSYVSKLGTGPMIVHEPKAIEGDIYGHIITYVKQKLPLDKQKFLEIIVNNS